MLKMVSALLNICFQTKQGQTWDEPVRLQGHSDQVHLNSKPKAIPRFILFQLDYLGDQVSCVAINDKSNLVASGGWDGRSLSSIFSLLIFSFQPIAIWCSFWVNFKEAMKSFIFRVIVWDLESATLLGEVKVPLFWVLSKTDFKLNS